MILDSFVAHAPLVAAVLIDSLWQGAGITVLLIATHALLGQQRSKARYSTALVALVVVTLLPTAALLSALAQPVVIVFAPTSAQPASRLAIAFTSVWLVGVLVMLGRIAGGRWSLARLVARAVPLPDEWETRFAALLQQCAPVRALARCSQDIDVPMALGWIRPVVLLPASVLTSLPPSSLELLIVHELAHLRRGDYLVNVLQSVAEALFFFNPFVWWVSHRIRIEREHCCDDVVVSLFPDRVGYAKALLGLATLRAPSQSPALAATGGVLMTRIQRLIGVGRGRSSRFAPVVVGVTLLLGAFGAATLSLAQSKPVATAQNPKAAWQVVCDAPTEVQPTGTDPAARFAGIAMWLNDRVQNAEVKNVLETIAPLDPKKKGQVMREHATQAGVNSCQLADLVDLFNGVAPQPSR